MSRRPDIPRDLVQRVRGIQDNVREGGRRNTGWIELDFSGAWDNYADASHATVAYMLGADGFVRLRGLIADGTSGTTAFVLPEGYQPQYLVKLGTIANTPGANPCAAAMVEVDANGVVKIYAANTDWVALDGLAFRAEADTPVIDLIDGE